jgi:NADPH:quinone reductase-like Zn-dependent oxidoreductase
MYAQETLIIVSDKSLDVGAYVQKRLNERGLDKVSMLQYTELDKLSLKEATCVVLPELFDSILSDMDETTICSIRHMLTTAARVLWVTRDMIANPEAAMANGIVRTLRWERDLDGSNLVSLSFRKDELSEAKLTDIITQVFDFQFLKQHDQRHAEYLYAEGLLNITRLYYSKRVNNFLHLKSAKPSPQNIPFGADPSRALSLAVRTPGLLDTLEFIDDAKHKSPLGDREIEVRIHATGLNFRDVMVAMNEIDDVALGLEAAGVITKIGGDNSQNLNVGDRVMMLSNITGCFQTYARTTQDLIVKIPENMPFEVAAAIPVTFSTAYYCLVDIARLARGDSILIHSAAGGVGQAAIMLSQHLGAVVYVTVSSKEKRDLMIEKYNIPKENIFSSRGLSFAQGIMRVTKNRGVDVVLNSLSGEALRRSWDCIAPFGRFIEIGKKDIYANGKLDMYAFSKSAMFAAVDLNLVIHLDPKTGGRLLKESLGLWEKTIVQITSPFNVFGYAQLEESFRMMQAGKHIGKVILKANADDIVRVCLRPHFHFVID